MLGLIKGDCTLYRCRAGAEVHMQRYSRGAAEVQRYRCRCRGADAEVQMQRCRGAEVLRCKVLRLSRHDCAGADKVQMQYRAQVQIRCRCRTGAETEVQSAEVQRYSGAEMEVLLKCRCADMEV